MLAGNDKRRKSMNRGCIAIGQMNCDECHRIIEDGEQYLLKEEEAKREHFCVECSLKNKYAKHFVENNEKQITFFT